MKQIIKIKEGAVWIKYAGSVTVHLILFFVISFILDAASESEMMRSPYVEVSTGMFTKENKISEEEDLEEIEEKPVEKEETAEPVKPEEKNVTYFYSLSDKNIDTTGLRNVYTEKTLNVRIKYPVGWTFIDQNVKKKLDGVTFWGLAEIYNPPPYIHLEVKEKYLFNPSRYKYSEEYDDYTIYFNDPEETADQYTQIIYIRTDDDEDYSLKLIMKGKESFKNFQPLFFGMLKTFKFG